MLLHEMNSYVECKKPKNYVFLDSRIATYNNNIFSFQLSEPITIKDSIRLLEAQIPNTNYNIDTPNNWIDIAISGTYSFQIPVGNYDAPTLASALQTLLTTNTGVSFTVTFNINTYLMTFSAPSAFSFLFGTGAHAANSAWSQLGFTQNLNTASGTSLTATNGVDVNSPNYVFIDIDNVDYASMRTCSGSTMFCVPLSVQKGTTESFSEMANFQQKTKFQCEQKLQRIDIAVYTTVVNVYGFAPYNFLGLPFTLIFEYE